MGETDVDEERVACRRGHPVAWIWVEPRWLAAGCEFGCGEMIA